MNEDSSPTQPTPNRRSWCLPLTGAVLLGGLCILGLVAVAGVIGLQIWDRERGFDAARWQQATEGCVEDNPRLGMYRDLEALLMRERPTRAEVLVLLGPPDGEPGAETISYSLGYNIIDCDFVSISFGSDDRVERVRYVQG